MACYRDSIFFFLIASAFNASLQPTNVSASHLPHQVSPHLSLSTVTEVAKKMGWVPHQLEARVEPIKLQPVQQLIQECKVVLRSPRLIHRTANISKYSKKTFQLLFRIKSLACFQVQNARKQ
jgi:hypothetical protein